MRNIRKHETHDSRINTINANFQELTAVALIKSIYHVFISQAGTAVATTTPLGDNSLTGVVISRTGVGTTLLTKEGAFPVGKAVPKIPVAAYTLTGAKLLLTPVSEDAYKLETFSAEDNEALADDILTDQELYIEIFNG